MMSKNPNTGITVKAEYSEQVLKEYQGNLLIEALPPIWSFEQVEELLHSYPEHEEYERKIDAHYRYHCVQRLFSYFQPWSTHFDIEQRISRVIRQGYLSRNPLAPNYASDMQSIYRMIKEGNYQFKNVELSTPSASGFTIIGFSGMGKTTGIEKILQRYPQLIIHDEYNSEAFDHKQLVWLKLDCPHDGSVKALCASFFIEFDKLLVDSTYDKFAAGRNTTTATMIPRMSQIARRHSLGLLVIDEIQHLSVAKSGGQEKMLNFFVNLVNTIGIPVILIGTTKAMSILQSEFRQARRGSGHQGDLVWENMDKTDDWDLLIEGMWNYQWTKNKVPLSKELKDALYWESQGIVDIAIKLYAMAQMRAIATGEETIMADLIKTIAEDNLKLVKPMLDALKSGKNEEIGKYHDIKPVDIESFCEKQLKTLNLNEMIRKKKVEKEKTQKEKDKVFEDVVLKLVEFDIKPEKAKKTAKDIIEEVQCEITVENVFKEALRQVLREDIKKEEKPEKKNSKSLKITKEEGDLRVIVEKGRNEKKSAYEALKDAGVIKNPVEEFIMTG
ncbi:MAG: ATP-binding protein [Clostridia bacterium]|nr:ATP-binding protein [Clostridia bacterium]